MNVFTPQVPMIMPSCSSRVMPWEMMLATVSIRPPTTGVPSASPVSAAHRAVT